MWASRFSTAGQRLSAIVDEVTELSQSNFETNGKSNNRPAPKEAERPA
jgi:hypothetical protein